MGLLLARSIMLLLRGKSTYTGCSVFPSHLWEWFAARNQFAIMFGERFDA